MVWAPQKRYTCHVSLSRRLLPVATWVVAFGVTTPCFAQEITITNGFNSGTPNTNASTNGGSLTILSGPVPSPPSSGQTTLNSSQFNTSTFGGVADIAISASGFSVAGSAVLTAQSIFVTSIVTTGSNLGFTAAPNAGIVQAVAPPIPKNNSFTLPSLGTVSPVVAQFSMPRFVNFGVPTDKINWSLNLQPKDPIVGEKDKKNSPLLKTLNYARNPYQPVAAGVPRALPFMQLSAVDRDSYLLRHDGTAEFATSNSNEFAIKSGSIFVVAHKPTVITHNDLRISLGAGAIAHVAASSNCLVVRTLHDQHMNDVKVSFGKESLAIPVGTELCIGTDENFVLEEINKDTMVRRSSLGAKLPSGQFGLTSTFPLHSMLSHPMLVNMYRHRIEDRPHIEKLMKMAACLHLAGRNNR